MPDSTSAQLAWVINEEKAAAKKAAAEKAAAEKAAAAKKAAEEKAVVERAAEGIGNKKASSRPSVKQFSVTEDGNLIESEVENDFTFKNNILSNTIDTFTNVFNKLFNEKDDFNILEITPQLNEGEDIKVIEDSLESNSFLKSPAKQNTKLRSFVLKSSKTSKFDKTFKNIAIFKSWNWVTVITKHMFKTAAYLAYNKVLKIKDLQLNNLESKELAEIYVNLIYKYIEQLFTSTGIISTFGTLLPGGQFLKTGSDLIFRYYKQYILLTEKYFEIEFIKKHFNKFDQNNLNLSVNTTVIRSKYEKLLTTFNDIFASAISGGKSKTKRQNKKAKQKSKTKKQNKKAKQKGKTKRQNKKAKQKGKTNMINY